MDQTPIPCLFMRAGTSRGPFFDAADLPPAGWRRDRLLVAALGSADDGLQLDGLGGGSSLTSKVAIVARSTRPGIDIDYTFAQVATDGSFVDTSPSCGNMLAGVGPFAIETGLVEATAPTTAVRIFDVNTESTIEAVVQTPGRRVTYAGETSIDGVSGTAAPVLLRFRDIVGARTGSLFPTGSRIDEIEGLSVTCIDVATPMVLIPAAQLGLTGHEMPAELDGRPDLFRRIERARLQAGWRMGLGDVSKSVLPKVALLAAPRAGGTISSRYLTPWRTHTSHAVTGAIAVASAAAIPGTIAEGLRDAAAVGSASGGCAVIEHPNGKMEIALEVEVDGERTSIASAGVVRTARLLMRGEVQVPPNPLPCRPLPEAAASREGAGAKPRPVSSHLVVHVSCRAPAVNKDG